MGSAQLKEKLLERIRISKEEWSSLDTPCWIWTSYCQNGYGRFAVKDENSKRYRLRLVHRLSYELFVGPIPVGLVIDHLCRISKCINPDHLEAVTNAENIMRGLIGGGSCDIPWMQEIEEKRQLKLKAIAERLDQYADDMLLHKWLMRGTGFEVLR